MSTKCKPPRHWISKTKKCQTFKRHKSWTKWTDSITSAWARRACNEEGVRSTQFVAEELKGTAQEIVEFMMYEPTVKRMRDVIPYEEVDGEYAIDERALQAAYPKVSADIIHELHVCLEFCLAMLIKEAAIVAKQKGLKSIQAKHINEIKLKYITPEMWEKYE